MNYLNRAWCYVTRKLSKSILLGLTFFVIGNLVLIGLGISEAAENAKILTRKEMRAVVSYEVDYNKFWQEAEKLESDEEREEMYKNYPTLDQNVIQTIMKDNRIKAANSLVATTMYSRNFDHVLVGNEALKNEHGGGMIVMNGVESKYVEPNITVQANSLPNMIELAEETYKVVDGRFYSQADIDSRKAVVLITSELASLNNLKVGDSISMWSTDKNTIDGIIKSSPQFTEDFFYKDYEIIGIFNNKNEVDPNSDQFKWMQAFESPKNIILMPATTYAEVQLAIQPKIAEYYNTLYGNKDDTTTHEFKLEDFMTPSKVVYLLNDPLEVDDFVLNYTGQLTKFTFLNANNEVFKKLAKPLDTLSFFSNIIVWIVTINAIVIISLVTALTLKTREHEIGVLLSMGVSKIKVVAQLFVELLIVALIGFTLAVGSGSLVAGKVGSAVLDFQKAASEPEQMDMMNHYSYYSSFEGNYFTEVSQEDLLAKYEVKIGWVIILEIYSLGMAVVFISIVIPSAMIMRLNPKQILLA